MAESPLDALLDSLLWEGYALYPYTPGATKNSTPTPFGIVYPPVYAATLDSTFDHLELRCVLHAPPDGVLSGEVRFLAPVGERHQAEPQALPVPGVMVGALPGLPATRSATIFGGPDVAPLQVELELGAEPLGDREWEVWLRAENRTLVSSGLDRAGALARSLLSTHPLLRAQGGRFVSALERPCRSVNTFPILAAPADDAMLGAAIVLPDHPQIAPESRGGLFDSTEIEEALLLHVQVLSDGERAEIEAADPAVREMIERAAAATPQEIVALHGRVTVRDPQTDAPPEPPPGLVDPSAGQAFVDLPHGSEGGGRVVRGGKVVLRPRAGADLHTRMAEGRTATVERIYTDYVGRTQLAVTIDDDPGQELMRESGRFLYFFLEEIEL